MKILSMVSMFIFIGFQINGQTNNTSKNTQKKNPPIQTNNTNIITSVVKPVNSAVNTTHTSIPSLNNTATNFHTSNPPVTNNNNTKTASRNNSINYSQSTISNTSVNNKVNNPQPIVNNSNNPAQTTNTSGKGNNNSRIYNSTNINNSNQTTNNPGNTINRYTQIQPVNNSANNNYRPNNSLNNSIRSTPISTSNNKNSNKPPLINNSDNVGQTVKLSRNTNNYSPSIGFLPIFYHQKTYYLDVIISGLYAKLWIRANQNGITPTDKIIMNISLSKTTLKSVHNDGLCKAKQYYDNGTTITGCLATVASGFCAVGTVETLGGAAAFCSSTWEYTADKGLADCVSGISDKIAEKIGMSREWSSFGAGLNLGSGKVKEAALKAIDIACANVK